MTSYRLAIGFFISLCLLGAGCSDMSSSSGWHEPLDRAATRDKKLTFGLYVTPDPEQNPIDPPERFTGYHAALDYEIFEQERDQDVNVYAVCDGEVVYKDAADGYGGTFIQQCNWKGEEVTVLYGHLDLASIRANVGESMRAGDVIGILGDHKSPETSDTRKHLHLGIHRGTGIALLGYVQSTSELESYIDPAQVFGY